MNKIERPTDKRLKEQINISVCFFYIFLLMFFILGVMYLCSNRTSTLIISCTSLILCCIMKVWELLDKIRLEVRGV